MAIKIVKPGKIKNPRDTRRFTCLLCGCVFDADRGDYEAFEVHQDIEYGAVCPTCHHTTYRSQPFTTAE